MCHRRARTAIEMVNDDGVLRVTVAEVVSYRLDAIRGMNFSRGALFNDDLQRQRKEN